MTGGQTYDPSLGRKLLSIVPSQKLHCVSLGPLKGFFELTTRPSRILILHSCFASGKQRNGLGQRSQTTLEITYATDFVKTHI